MDTDAALDRRIFLKYGTGWLVAERNIKFVGTVFEDIFEQLTI